MNHFNTMRALAVWHAEFRRFRLLAICLAAVLSTFSPAYGQLPLGVRAVDADAPGPGHTGLSWEDAYLDIQPALEEASEKENGVTQIWVAAGTYVPSEFLFGTPPKTFALVPGVKVLGGFAGGEATPGARNPEVNITTISGDLNQDDAASSCCVAGTDPGCDDPACEALICSSDPFCCDTAWDALCVGRACDGKGSPTCDELCATTDNQWRIVTAFQVDDLTVLSGFTITRGINAIGGDGSDAGGMLIQFASPRITRCRFVRNSAARGGGIFVVSDDDFGLSEPALINCSFLGNAAALSGGAVNIELGVTASSAVFFANCVFAGNIAGEGAAVDIGANESGQGSLDFVNCTLSGGSARTSTGGIVVRLNIAATIANSIMWDNTPPQITDLAGPGGFVAVSYSDIEGGWPGTGNFGEDPLLDDPKFCDAGGPDGITGTIDDNLRLGDSSPCIDAGVDQAVPADFADVDDDGEPTETLPWDRDNEKPLTQWGRFFNVVSGPSNTKVDMGAYENQHIAACDWDISSPGYGPPPDQSVGNPDFLMLIVDWGSCPGCGADFNCDLVVNTTDYLELLAHWGPCPGSGGQAPQGGEAPSPAGQGDGGGSGLTVEEALLVLGFASLEDYGLWLSMLSDEEVYASSVVLIALLSG